MTKRQKFIKFHNLSEKVLNTKSNKKTYVRNDVMTTIIKQCRGEKTRGIRPIDRFRKKLRFQILKVLNIQNLKSN